MTTLLDLPEGKATGSDEILPPIGQHVIVQCDGFRCVGMCGRDGKWVDAYNEQALPDVLWFKPLW